MNCNEISELMLEYIENKLDSNVMKSISEHLKECDKCREEYNSIKEMNTLLNESVDTINIPKQFSNNVEEKVYKSYVKTHHRKTKSFKITLVACLIIIISVVTVIAQETNIINFWDLFSNNNNIENSIEHGVGNELNLSQIDKDIKITLKNVVADDTTTTISFTIEDLKNNNKYMLGRMLEHGREEGWKIEDYWYTEEETENGYSYLPGEIFVSFEEDYSDCKLELEPLDEDEKTIKFNINKLELADDNKQVITGNWNFEFDVKKYKSKKYSINKTVKINGYDIKFTDIEIAPTKTILSYEYPNGYINQYNDIKEHVFTGLRDVYLSCGDKNYQQKRWGWTNNYLLQYQDFNIKVKNETLIFDSIYFDNPEKIKINIRSFGEYIYDKKKYEVDLNKLPYEFEYNGSKIIAVDTENDEHNDVVLNLNLKCNVDNNVIETFDFNARRKQLNISLHSTWNGNGIVVDDEGNKYDSLGANLIMDKIRDKNPEFYIKNAKIKFWAYYAKNTEELIYLTEPEQFTKPLILEIIGYSQNVKTNKSVRVRLNKPIE